MSPLRRATRGPTPCLALILVSASLVAESASLSRGELALFANLSDPAFYTYPHRREALADVLATAETMLAASNTYARTKEAGPLLHGPPANTLRFLAAGGGRAGEIARIILVEAEKGLYGDASQPLRTHVEADSTSVAEVLVPPGATRRVLVGTTGSGRLVVSGTCGFELRRIPRNEQGEVDVSAALAETQFVDPTDTLTTPISAPTEAFGVARSHGCDLPEQKLFFAWAAAPPLADFDGNGQQTIRKAGRYQIKLSEGMAMLGFDLPESGIYEVSSADKSVSLAVRGPALDDRQYLLGGVSSGRLDGFGRTFVDLVVIEQRVSTIVPGEVLPATSAASSQLFQVRVPRNTTGTIRVESISPNDQDDPIIYRYGIDGEVVDSDDDSGEGLNAMIEGPVSAGSVLTFAIANQLSGTTAPVRVTEVTPSTQSVGD